jgi:hypothetical protein
MLKSNHGIRQSSEHAAILAKDELLSRRRLQVSGFRKGKDLMPVA